MPNQAATVDRDDLSKATLSGNAEEKAKAFSPSGLSDLIGLWLLYLLPVLFIAGRAPAEIAMSVVALLFLVRSQLGLGWYWLKTPWLTAALVFWGYLLLVSAFAIEPEDSFGRALPFIRFILFAAALQHWLLVDKYRIKMFLTVLALAVGFVILDCLYQYVLGVDIFGKAPEGYFRLSGPFNNDVAGTFIAKTSLPLIGWWLAWSVSKRHLSWLIGGLLAAMIGVVIMLTGERMALGTYGIGLLVVILCIKEVRLPLMLIGLVGLTGLGATITANQTLYQRYIGHTLADVDDFWSGRYGVIIVKAFDVWKEAPLTGVGLKNFRLTCETPNFDHEGPVDSWCFTHPHNPYMELLSETGVLGLLLFLLVMGLVLRDQSIGWKSARPDFPLNVGAAASLILFLWPMLISKSIFSNWNGMLLWLMIGLSLAIAFPRSPAATRGMQKSVDQVS